MSYISVGSLTSSLLVVDLRAPYSVISTELACFVEGDSILVFWRLIEEYLDLFEGLLD